MLLVKFLEQVYEACLVGYHETCGDENRRVCIVISYQFQAWRTEPHTTGSYSLVVEDFSTEATEKLHLCCPNVLSGSPVSVFWSSGGVTCFADSQVCAPGRAAQPSASCMAQQELFIL